MTALVPVPRAAPEPAILRIVDGLCRPEERILARVAQRVERTRARRGLGGVALREAVAHDLVFDHAVLSALLNAAGALPYDLPLAGPAVSTAVTVLATVVGDLALQTELTVALAGALGSPLRGPALRRVCRRAIHMAGERDYRDTAWTVALRVTVKKLAVRGLAQALARGGFLLAAGGSSTMFSPATAATLAGWAATPVVAAIAWRDMRAVSDRARAALEAEGPLPTEE